MSNHQPKTLSERLTHGYLMVLRDEETFEERVSMRINAARIIVMAFFCFVAVFTASYFISGFIHEAISPNTSKNLSRQAVLLSQKADSLETVLESNARYMKNIRSILSESIKVRSLEAHKEEQETSKLVSTDELDTLSEVDKKFRTAFEGTDFELRGGREKANLLGSMVLFPPVRGIVTKNYEVQSEHYGLDIVAPKNEPIKAVAEGTVVMASWTQDSGYVIGIQHENQLLSFYKHNSVLLKKVGDFVRTGEPVAIIGNSGEYTDGPHLHVELWHHGDPINPRAFIKF